MRKITISFLLAFVCNILQAQNEIKGVIFSKGKQLPIEYVNIGIPQKNIGTVTDKDGAFRILINPEYNSDTLLFSCIGYESYSIKVSCLEQDNIIYLKEKLFTLDEVVIKPLSIKEKRLGNTSNSKMLIGFENNLLGYECGLLLKTKKKTIIKKLNINIANCSYDSIFFRINVYKVNGKKDFRNILKEPIYLNVSKEEALNGLTIDLEDKSIIVNSNFLVTLEHVKDLGPGGLHFPLSLKQKTYYRKTSQGKWRTAPVGISLNVIADIEK